MLLWGRGRKGLSSDSGRGWKSCVVMEEKGWGGKWYVFMGSARDARIKLYCGGGEMEHQGKVDISW